jgi:hypothetical protein
MQEMIFGAVSDVGWIIRLMIDVLGVDISAISEESETPIQASGMGVLPSVQDYANDSYSLVKIGMSSTDLLAVISNQQYLLHLKANVLQQRELMTHKQPSEYRSHEIYSRC